MLLVHSAADLPSPASVAFRAQAIAHVEQVCRVYLPIAVDVGIDLSVDINYRIMLANNEMLATAFYWPGRWPIPCAM